MDASRLAELDRMAVEGSGFGWRLVHELLVGLHDEMDANAELGERCGMLLGVASEYPGGVPAAMIRQVLAEGTRPATPSEMSAASAAMRLGVSVTE